MQIEQIQVDVHVDIRKNRTQSLGVTLMSRDINNYKFYLRVLQDNELLIMDDSYEVEVLSLFTTSKTRLLTKGVIKTHYVDWQFDPSYISKSEVVKNYVYVRKDGELLISADANCFIFEVGLSAIDRDNDRVAEFYDENYQRYLDEFKDVADFTKIEVAEKERQANEDVRIANEILREENYNQKVDTAIVEADVVAKVDNKVTELTPQITSLTAQLAKTEKMFSGLVKYGKVSLPDDFPKLPFNLFRSFDGIIRHDYDFAKHKYSQKIYLSESGNSSNDGLSPESPIKNWAEVIAKINTLPQNNINLVILDKFYSMLWFETSQIISVRKNITISSAHENGTFIVSASGKGLWVEADGIHKVTRSQAQKVFFYDNLDTWGNPVEIKKVDSLLECQQELNTWYTDGTDVWINKEGMSAGKSQDVEIMIPYDLSLRFDFTHNTLVLDNIKFLIKHTEGKTRKHNALEIRGNINTKFIARKLSCKYSANNGLATINVGTSLIFDSSSQYNSVDGFNYHGNSSGLVFEYNCYASDNGTVVEGSANATTAHDGMSILRVGSIGERCYGPVLADVNGCYSINLDCRMYDSLLVAEQTATKAAFYFSDSGGENPTKAILINCEGGGKDTFTLFANTANPIKVSNFKGGNIRDGSKVEYV